MSGDAVILHSDMNSFYAAVEDIRERYGKRALTYGSLLGDIKMPDDGRHIVRMPDLMFH